LVWEFLKMSLGFISELKYIENIEKKKKESNDLLLKL
jgi:hypothetical protein